MLPAKSIVDLFRDEEASPLESQDESEVEPETKMRGRDIKQSPTTENGQFRLLLVDADVRVWESVFDVLQSDLSEFICEASTDDLEKVLVSNPPFDVILIDVYNPVEKFLELTSLVKAMAPRTEVIFMSRFFDPQLRRRSLQCGAYDCLPKPLDKNELREIILDAIDQNRTSGCPLPLIGAPNSFLH